MESFELNEATEVILIIWTTKQDYKGHFIKIGRKLQKFDTAMFKRYLNCFSGWLSFHIKYGRKILIFNIHFTLKL